MKPPINVDIGVGAKAEIKAEVPTSSVGRFVDALTDMIRPFAEARGLRADQIRLQREDVLIEIAKKARDRLALENLSPQSLPNKFLIPFLEAASLEDVRDDKLTDMWANLLASASRDSGSKSPIFISILKELTGEEASLFEFVFTHYSLTGEKCHSKTHFEDAKYLLRPVSLLLFVRRLLRSDPETWPKKIMDQFDGPGLHVRSVTVAEGKRPPLADVAHFYDKARPVREFSDLSFELLVRAGLLSKIEIDELRVSPQYAIDVLAYAVTDVGVEFFRSVASPSALKAAEDCIQ